jgi:membrane fusion protein (multidrug efflux system)
MQGNYNVFVVNAENEVEFRKVEVAFSYQTGFLVISSGLSPGEKLIYEGLQKVSGGSKVNPVVREITIPESEN